jgi:hypothetical protein
MPPRIRFLLAALLIPLAAGVNRADYAFTFADGSGNPITSSSISVASGSTVSVEVLLTQTGGATGLSASGLNQAGVQLNGYNTSNVTVAGVTPNDTAHGGAFDAVNTTTSINNGGSTGAAKLTEGYLNPNTGLAGASVYLGTFTFTAGAPGTTSTVTAVAYPGQDNNVLANGTVIDGLISNANLAITVTAVPEPGTLVLTGLLAGGVAGAGVRRLRRRQTA